MKNSQKNFSVHIFRVVFRTPWRNTYKFGLSLLIGMMLSELLIGCQSSQIQSGKTQPKVVVTSTIIEDLTKKVGGENIEVIGILKPGTDPHIYEPTPRDSQALETADLILYNGYDLEPGIIKLIHSTGLRGRKLALGELVPPLSINKNGKKVSDPHVWGSGENGIIMVNGIKQALSELSPEAREKFTENASQLTEELQRLNQWIQQQIQTIPPRQRRLITTHDAFQYYGKTYGIEIAGTLIGMSTEEQPSAQTVKKLVESIKMTGVPAIFAETTINPQLIQTVAEESGIKLAPDQLYSDSIGIPGSRGDSYVKMLKANTEAIVLALGGKVTPFK